MIYNRKELEKQHQSGKKLKYLFFWGNKKSLDTTISSSCFSQWYNQKFKIDGIEYPTAEHYMMAEKARLFNDKDAEKRILKSKSPAEAKRIGREILNFNQELWEANRINIVVKGNYAKFSQNIELKKIFTEHKEKILVEASPVDKIWGIGLDKTSEFANIPTKWRGLNLLGFALMEVRDLLIHNNKTLK